MGAAAGAAGIAERERGIGGTASAVGMVGIGALISASGAWRGDVSLPYGTMLAFIAWYNPVLAEALRFCVKL